MKKSKSNQHLPDPTPGIVHDTARKYFETGTEPWIDRNRWFLISLILSVAVLGMGMALYVLLPLKTVETFQVTKVEGGRYVVDATPVGNWNADNDAIGYFLNQWANNVFDINRSTIDRTIAQSASIAIGNANAQLRELRLKDNPWVLLRENADFNRSYKYRSINFIKDDVALLRFETTTRKAGLAKNVYYAMTITFTRIKPKTRDQVISNPAGLYITNFNITEEVVAK